MKFDPKIHEQKTGSQAFQPPSGEDGVSGDAAVYTAVHNAHTNCTDCS